MADKRQHFPDSIPKPDSQAKWKWWYIAVIGELIVLIAVFTAITAYFR